MALGARGVDIGRLIVTRGVVPVAAGILAGLLLGLWAGRLAGAFLYEIAPSDPLTFALCAGVLGAIGIGAVYFPARRASRIDPAEALRHE